MYNLRILLLLFLFEFLIELGFIEIDWSDDSGHAFDTCCLFYRRELAKDFVVSGTASESLYGACEAMYKPDMVYSLENSSFYYRITWKSPSYIGFYYRI